MVAKPDTIPYKGEVTPFQKRIERFLKQVSKQLRGKPMFYRVVNHGYYGKWYKVQVWRWWWPFWTTVREYLDTEEDAAEFIRGHSVYYDGV